MGVYEETLEANQQYARSFGLGSLPMPPARKLAVVACMDARLTVEQFLGLKTGEAHIIRNAGGLATEDALRSLIISTRLLGTRTIYVIEHTDCGMLTFQDEQLRQQLKKESGQETSHLHFLAFADLEENLRAQLRRIRENPFLRRDIDLHGFVYDVRSGRLREVRESGAEAQAASLSSR
ncbi:MAG TPA: carbonic anhydrase [Candidatus Acidoferrales bacterium]|nr:carbonic anhydrase [Candidatus Acidoferrales bacterium]